MSDILWEPQPKQKLALQCPADQIFFGGAAGGGKTDVSLAFCIRDAKINKKYSHAIVFRKTYPQLVELLRRARELFIPLGADYAKIEHTFTFKNGATVEFKNLDADEDVENYQGRQFTLVIFDELANWPTDYCWTYMASRVRSPQGIAGQMLGTGNPGGKGHLWVKNKFIDGFKPNVMYKVPVSYSKSEKRYNYISQCFIPSRLEDNSFLMQNRKYADYLDSLPTNLRRMLRYGDWDVFEGQVFDEWRREKHVVKPIALKQGEWKRFYVLDWNYSKPYAIAKFAVNSYGKVYQYGELYGMVPGKPNVGVKMASVDVAKIAWEDAFKEGVTDMIADPAIWGKADGGPTIAENFGSAGFNMIKAHNDRITGLIKVHDYLKTMGMDKKPMFQIFNICVDTIRTLPVLLPNRNHPEDIDTDMEDHLYDCVRYGLMSDFAASPEEEVARMKLDFLKKPNGQVYHAVDNLRRRAA
jgi:hypothetical protein